MGKINEEEYKNLSRNKNYVRYPYNRLPIGFLLDKALNDIPVLIFNLKLTQNHTPLIHILRSRMFRY